MKLNPALPCRLLLLLSLACSQIAMAADATTPANPSAAISSRPLTVVALSNPRGLVVDRSGTIYVADLDTGKIHKITPAGEVTPVAAAIRTPIGLALRPDGALWVADAEDDAVYRITAEGALTSVARPTGEAAFNSPTTLALDAAGNVFVANNLGNAILKITPEGLATVFAGKPGAAGSADGQGSEARFGAPLGIAIDGDGNLYVADKDNSNIRKITPAGMVSTLAGKAGESGSADGMGAEARFAAPRAVAVDSGGNVYVADTENNCVRKISAAGRVTTLAGQAGQAGRVDGSGAGARFNDPRGIAVDEAGMVYVADGGNSAVRRIGSDGMVTTIAAAAPAGTTVAISGPAPVVPPRTGETERIDYSHAQTLDGWDGDLSYWTVKDGVFTAKGEKVPSTFLLTQKLYTDFRLTLSSQVVVSDNHAGVCLWGERKSTPRNPYAYKGPLVIFPGLGMWDYRTNKGIPVDPVGKALARKIAGQHDLIRVEILAQGNRIRVAYNGQQVLDWREPDPSSLTAGPIGLQLHGYTKPQEVVYRDVVIETFPTEDRLITVKE